MDRPASEERTPQMPIAWASGALLLTGVVAVLAKSFGTIVSPGIRGVAGGRTVDLVDTGSAALAYALTALLVALVCGASFELARSRALPVAVRGGVVALSGLVVALASPAVITRLQSPAAFALALVTSLIALGGGLVTARAAHTRALGTVVSLLAVAATLRPFAWAVTSMGAERSSVTLANVSTAMVCVAIVLHAVATLLAAVWLATRSLWAGRIAANVALLGAFAITWLALRETDGPTSSLDAVLRTAFGPLLQSSLPFGFAAVAVFLVPASILLALVAVMQRKQAPAVTASLALTLVAGGSFDVPLQALAAVAGAQWAMLAMADPRGLWSVLMNQRFGVKQPMSIDEPSS